MKLSIFFAWYDLWIGAYFDRDRRTAYVCLIPCVVLKIDCRRPHRSRSPAHLRPASSYACESCGRENFVAHIAPDMSREEFVELMVGEFDMSREEAESQQGEWLWCPDEVTCRYCDCTQPTPREGTP